ncbi:hypothetical protein ACFL4Z_03525 [candidate division KSB1 bacterium]
MGKERMDAMDSESPCARYLKNLDRNALLKKDIQHFCDEVSTLEAAKILSLSSKLILSNTEDADRYKEEIKSVASGVMKRVKKKTGNLTPECRNLQLNLWED